MCTAQQHSRMVASNVYFDLPSLGQTSLLLRLLSGWDRRDMVENLVQRRQLLPFALMCYANRSEGICTPESRDGLDSVLTTSPQAITNACLFTKRLDTRFAVLNGTRL